MNGGEERERKKTTCIVEVLCYYYVIFESVAKGFVGNHNMHNMGTISKQLMINAILYL